MKRNLWLLGIVIVLMLIFFFILNKNTESNSSIDESQRNFRIENTEDIAKIFIVQKGRSPFSFTKEDGTWIMNKEYKANQNSIIGILNFFKKNRIKFIPSKAATENIIKEIALIGLKVEVFDKADNLMKSFYVGGNTPDERGTYFLMENGTQPFVLELPAQVAVLRERFLRTEDEWRAYSVFEYDTDDITEINVEYPKHKNHSFKIKRKGSLEVDPYYEGAVQYFENPNQSLVDAYIKDFNVMYCEAVDNLHSRKDSIAGLVPFVVISVEAKNQEKKSIRLYSFNDVMNPKERMKPMDFQSKDRIERFYAASSWGDFYIIQMRLIKKFLRSYAYFFET